MTANLSDGTRKTLQQFGWQDADPIPANISDILADIYTRNPNCRSAGLYVDITALDEADIAKIKEALEAEKVAEAARKAKAEREAKTAGMSPEMKALYEKVSQSGPAVEIVDDRATAAEPPQVTPPAPQPPPEVKREEPEVKIEPEPIKEVFCPRCTWDMRQRYEVMPTEADKEVFIVSVLGGTRMQKNYKIMGDKYEIKFRGLLAEENKQIHRQLLLEQKRDEFQSDTEWFLRFFEYRLACSVEVIIANDKVLAVVPELADVEKTELPNKTDDKALTPLERLRNYVVADLLKTEITRRLVSGKFREFQRLYEALEAMALEPNFW
jgi:hypothetical protein